MVTGQKFRTEQPAKVELLDALFADMGVDDYSSEAQQAARHYFTRLIEKAQEDTESKECWFSMGDLTQLAWVFLDVYDAGKAGNTKPEPS